MIQIEKIVFTFSRHGLGPYICVPCSFLKPFINFVIDSPDLHYIKSASEGEAVGIAAGSFLCGNLPIVMMQNSGLGNAINPITSLTNIYQIPFLSLISMRGAATIKDEPQHAIMGKITKEMLDLVGIDSSPFPSCEDHLEQTITSAVSSMRTTSLPYSFLLEKGTVESYTLTSKEERHLEEGFCSTEEKKMETIQDRINAIETILSHLDGDEPIISTTGMISRELFTLSDRPNHFYMVGSMGCASSVAFGISLHKQKKKIIIFDGDGALLMKMGTVATIGHYAPKNIVHIVLDNESYESTGGQATVSSTVNIARMATCCGYKTGTTVYSKNYLSQTLKELLKIPGPHLITVKVKKGHPENIGRPTITPIEAKERFSDYLVSIH